VAEAASWGAGGRVRPIIARGGAGGSTVTAMTRRHARFALLYWVPICLVASQTVGPGPLVFFEQPIHFVLLYLGPPVALVLLVLSFVGPKARPRVRPGSEQNREEEEAPDQ
jgi:hypothetical protein